MLLVVFVLAAVIAVLLVYLVHTVGSMSSEISDKDFWIDYYVGANDFLRKQVKRLEDAKDLLEIRLDYLERKHEDIREIVYSGEKENENNPCEETKDV